MSVNPDIAFALASAPAQVRPGLEALWALDEALGKVLATGREPMIRQIRLAWWREALERLDREAPPMEPVLEGVTAQLLPAGMSGASLAQMEAGWAALLGDEPITVAELEVYADHRGGLMFRHAATLLGGTSDALEPAGRAWALVDLARHSSERKDVEAALAMARAERLPARWPRRLRPLGMVAVLAARDLARGPDRWEEPGVPPRAARMMRHRLTGW